MTELRNVITATYELEDGFRIDIVITESMYEAYLYNIRYGIKTEMFGVDKSESSYDDFVATIEIAAYNDYYIDDYRNEYMD